MAVHHDQASADPGPTRSRITLAAVASLPVGETLHDTELTGFSIRRQGKAAVYSVRGTLKGQKLRVTISKHGAFNPARRVERYREESKQRL